MMRPLRWWQIGLAVLGVIAVVALLLRPRPQETITTVPVEGGGTYTEALVGAPRLLNPLFAGLNPVDRDLTRLIFSGLTRPDSRGRPTPELANWVVSEDQKTYTFILKPTASWHDGQPLTADDVAFTIDLMRDPSSPLSQDLRNLWSTVGVVVTGSQTIALTLPEPFAPFLDYTSFGILPRHVLGDTPPAGLAQAPFNLQPVGSGPFQFQRWRVGDDNVVEGIELTAFPNYIGGQPGMGGVNFRFFADSEAAFEAYQSGSVQGLARVPEPLLPEAMALQDLNLYTAYQPQTTIVFLNLRDETLPFFREKRVRQALLLGFNRDRVVADVLNGQASVANSPILPGSWAHAGDLAAAPYDPARAAKLLDDAGWLLPADAVAGTSTYVRSKDGALFSFMLIVPDTERHMRIAQMAQVDWAAIGIQVQVTSVPASTLRSQYLDTRTYQALLIDFSLAGTPDPDPYPFWHQTQVESGQNYSGLDDRITSQYLEEARITTDLGARARIYRSFQTRFADLVPALLLYYPTTTYGVRNNIANVSLGALSDESQRFATITRWQVTTTRVVTGEGDAGPTPTP